MFVCLGINHHTAPVELRERMAVAQEKLAGAVHELTALEPIREAVLLSTCNRVEIYAAVNDDAEPADGIRALDQYLRGHFGLEPDAEHFYRHAREAAARHLFRVVSGLDSMVLGETEIFGQVKKAYSEALAAGATARALNKLFQTAFRVGKAVRNETKIQRGSTSVGSVAVDLAERIFGDLRECDVMILGAGEMSRTTAQSLRSRGARSIIVSNRSYDKAVQLAGEMGGKAVRFDSFADEIKGVDIVISSTGAPHYVIHRDHLAAALRARRGRPLFLIDIAVPRDIDPAAAELEDVYVFDIDELESIADEARQERQRQIQGCEAMIDSFLAEIEMGQTQGASPSPVPVPGEQIANH
ncbi:MAG: glutamyl-tRNA reductase [Verrucomicrobiales bacterium]